MFIRNKWKQWVSEKEQQEQERVEAMQAFALEKERIKKEEEKNYAISVEYKVKYLVNACFTDKNIRTTFLQLTEDKIAILFYCNDHHVRSVNDVYYYDGRFGLVIKNKEDEDYDFRVSLIPWRCKRAGITDLICYADIKNPEAYDYLQNTPSLFNQRELQYLWQKSLKNIPIPDNSSDDF